MKDNQTARKKQQEAKILNAEKNAQNQADESICCSEHLLLFKYFHQTEEQQEKTPIDGISLRKSIDTA